MSSQGLSIAIRADTTGLAQGFAAARAQTQDFADAVNATGAQMANVFAIAGAASRGQAAASRAAAVAAREQAGEEIAFARNAAAQIAGINRSTLSTDTALARLSLDAEKQILDEQVENHQITAQQKYDILRQLTEREEALNEQALRSDEQTQGQSLARQVEDIDKIRELRAQLTVELAALAHQETESVKQENQKQIESWQSVVGEITSAESGLVNDILTKRKSLVADLQQIGLQLVQSEIANDLRYYTSHLMYNALGLASDETTERGGLLAHLLSETQKTAATATGVSARTAATVAGASAGKAAQSIAAASTISQDAAQAAAGTYSAVAQIPIIGPYLAPEAAMGAYAAVMAYGTLASAEGGQWQVPGHEQLTMLHRNEMVLPADLAEGVRGAVAGRAVESAGSGDVNLHYAPTIHSQGAKGLDDLLREQGSTMLAWVQARIRDRSLKLG